jgi:hypothetical protein
MLIGMTENRFLYVTTSKKENGFLLIEVFSKLINPQNDGHLDQLRVAVYYFLGTGRIS